MENSNIEEEIAFKTVVRGYIENVRELINMALKSAEREQEIVEIVLEKAWCQRKEFDGKLLEEFIYMCAAKEIMLCLPEEVWNEL